MVAKHLYKCNHSLYDKYFTHQANLGQSGRGIPVYKASGNGLGSIFSGLFRTAAPLLRETGKTLLREGVNTGLGVLKDLTAGKSVKGALKHRSKEASQRIIKKAFDRGAAAIKLGPRKNIKQRKIKKLGHKPTTSKRRKRSYPKDIFGS